VRVAVKAAASTFRCVVFQMPHPETHSSLKFPVLLAAITFLRLGGLAAELAQFALVNASHK
jgi:hypothetical protein